MRAMVLAAVLVLAAAPMAHAATASPFAYRASPYLADDATDWTVQVAPSTVRVFSSRPPPPEADWRALADLVVCSTLHHPLVTAGLVAFTVPTVVEFHGGGDPAGPLVGRVLVEAVVCGEGA